MKHIVGFAVAVGLVLVSIWWGFAYFHDDIYEYFNIDSKYSIFFGEVGMSVMVADDPAEWEQGLSNIRSLAELEGMLFIFDKPGRYAMWMKDMNIPIDIIWIDNDFRVIHIEKQVTPETFPNTFVSDQDARFVLETNADFVNSFNITVGSVLSLPQSLIPKDLQKQ